MRARVCASCGRATKAGARFCGGCGASLAQRCPACGAETDPDTRFCEACGASLHARPADAGVERKVVTVVFADLIGSTALHESLDPESVRRIMEGYHRSVRASVEGHGGTVVQLLGDGVMSAFGVPSVAEDDALRAVRAAVDVQRSFREFVREHGELAGRVGLRVAVNTGEVVVSDDYAAGIGDPLNVAARLQQEAKDGDVLLGEATQRLVAERVTLARVGSFALKGRAEAVTAYRVVSLERPAGAAATPFVGRDDELRRLTAVYDAAIAAPAARLAVLLGSPGLGKSRLLDELARQLEGRASVLTAQCNPGGGATFAPLAEALRTHLQLEAGTAGEALRAAIDARVPGDDAERARIASGIGALLAGTPASPEETFFVVRRLLSALAAERPVVLAIDDLQWAEPLLLDFTEHLVQWGAGVPLLVLAAARPELRDTRSSFTTAGGLTSDVLTLGGLDAGAAMRLAANVIGADTLPATVAGRVLTTSEGNPLFLRELVRMLVNDGALRREGERWTLAVDLARLEIPPTIQALLAARIERLRAEERLVLERAAVVGRQFSRAAVTHLLPREAHADLDARLEALRRSELIEADTGWLLGEPALRFHHVLIRDAAYRRVLRGTRAELHARFADWLEARAGASAEQDETIGWHLEQAHHHLRELGPLDANGRALGERAARDLAAAGRRALARDDLQPAASLLGRALACLGDADPARAELTLDWCEALLAAGDVGTAAGAIAELGRFTGGSERLRAWHTCFSGQLAALADPKALRASAEAVAAAAEALAAAGDTAGESKAHAVHADALVRLGMIGACEAALDRALAAARRINDRRRANTVLATLPLAVLWGPSPVTRASGRCLDVVRVLRITEGAPAVEAVALRCQAVLETLRGRSEAARRMIASSRRLLEELGITQRLLEADMFAGLIELLEGDAVASERWLRPAYDGFREHGLGVDAARAAVLLGRALLAQGRAAEAEALSHESEALAGDDFKAAIAWRGVRAEALAGRGEHAAAIELARAAVEIAAATDDLLDHADARSALAVALRAAGRSHQAGEEEALAIELWEQKGATLLAERARRGVAPVAPPERAPAEREERPRRERRRVRPNAAFANVRAVEAAMAARNTDAFEHLIADNATSLNHSTGAELDRSQLRHSMRSFLDAENFTLACDPLATLGDRLALFRDSMSASGVARGNLDVGAYERESIVLSEVDAEGRRRRTEYFAPRRLDDAIARLYERYAELLPDGPERTRAAATARSVAALQRELDVDRWATAISPAVEFIDHRHLGLPARRGAKEHLDHLRTLFELADDVATRTDDVLALRSDAFLVRRTNFGTERTAGGPFEREFLILSVFGSDGLQTHAEMFDVDRDAEAHARFDELTAEPRAASTTRRSVRANRATTHADRLNAAIAARDARMVHSLTSDGMHAVLHPTGAVLDGQEVLDWWRLFFEEDRDGGFRVDPVATLGDSLALCRQSWTGSASADAVFDVGPYQRDALALIEGDAEGRIERSEVFAPDRLGDAVVRLYERYAELLPDGPERARTAATATAVAAFLQSTDPDRRASGFAPAIEFLDHRIVGSGPLHGADAVLRGIRTLFELSEDWVDLIDDVLGLQSDALLVRWTHSGTDRASGGAFERSLCELFIFGADGLMERWEQFDAEQDVEALGRFEALTAEPRAATRAVRRRVRANAATANLGRLEAAIAARDADALSGLYADPSDVVEHKTGVTYDRRGALANWRLLLRAREPAFRPQALATLGGSLALSRWSTSAQEFAAGRFHVGDYEQEVIALIEVDASGRALHSEYFPSDRLGDAVTRLYERYAVLLPQGPERARAAATARGVAKLQRFDLDRAALAPAVEFVDHRPLGFPRTSGTEAYLRRVGSRREVADDLATRIDDVLALQADALLVRWMTYGIDRTGGGSFESPLLYLSVFGPDGLVTHTEMFDADRDAEALARFDELTGELAAELFANAAWRAAEEWERAMMRRDWDALVAGIAPGCMLDDRRSLVGIRLEGEPFFANLRFLFNARVEGGRQLLATRGQRLALDRQVLTSSARHGGLAEFEVLGTLEVDSTGRAAALVVFDPGDLDAAYTELDARYAAGDAAPHARSWEALQRLFSGIATRDWEELTRWIVPDLVLRDRRQLGLHELRSREEYLARIRSLVQLAPDARLRLEHVLALDDRGALCVVRWLGSREGGSFEIPFLTVMGLGADRRFREFHSYDLDQLEEARARFAELVVAPPTPWVANAATLALQRGLEAMQARDWERFAALFAKEFRNIDRRPLVRLELDRNAWLASYRQIVDMTSSRPTREVLATRGERLALARVTWEGSDLAVGPSEINWLLLIEVDARGDHLAVIAFDPEDLDAAYAELDQRYVAGEAAPFVAVAAGGLAFTAAVRARNWDSLANVLAPDLAVYDHRRLGWETLHGPALLVDTWKSLVELAPDVRVRIDHALASHNGSLAVLTLSGTHEGGAFEDTRVVVHVYDGNGKIRQHDIFGIDQLDQARARFEAIAAGPPRDPLAALVRANAASAAMDRLQASFEARDWSAARRLAAEGARFEDRRRHALASGDVDWWLADLKQVAEADVGEVHYQRTLVATAGDRACLERVLWTGGPAEGRVEIEYLWLAEVDESGQLLAGVMFEPRDWRAAGREAWRRWLARDAAAAAVIAPILELNEGMNDHDRARMKGVLADELVLNDRRLAGVGQVDGADAYLDTVVALWDLAPDFQLEPRVVLALERHGIVAVTRTFGTLSEGGPFERYLVQVVTVARGRLARIEQFELDQVDAALARLAELRPDPLRIPENAATRANDRWWALAEAEEWDAVGELTAGMVFEDRRRLIRIGGGEELLLADTRHLWESGWRPARTLLATAGDRLALERMLWTLRHGAQVSEIEVLKVAEVDAEGNIVAYLIFDPDDRRAAAREMLDRWARSDAAYGLPVRNRRAILDRDLDRLRAELPGGFVFHDHRLAGAGRIQGADAYVAWTATLLSASPDAINEVLYYVAVERHAHLAVAHDFGTLVDGGAFESVYAVVAGPDRTELFELEDLELARARFEELRPAPTRIPGVRIAP